jgi:MraZ protein
LQTRIIGEHKLALTQKNRLVIPIKFRQYLHGQKEIYISSYNFGWLEIYPSDYWQELVKTLEKLPKFSTDRRDFTKLIYSQTQTVELDVQGRFVLTETMLQNLDILNLEDRKSEIYAVGAGGHIEIWEKERWEMQKQRLVKNIDSISDRIALLSSNYDKAK